MNLLAHLQSVATASPPFVFKQSDVARVATTMFSDRYADFDRLSRVFETSGIVTRHAVRPMEWYAQPLGWPERTAAFIEGGEALFIEAATKALAAANLSAADVDTVVTVTSTGVATPSLEARVAARMGFRSDIGRVPVFGLGCAGGVSGVSIAARLAVARPGTNVLLVVVELCTLSFRLDELTKANIVATALFGDGAAACVLRAGDGGLAAIEAAGEHTWPDTLDIMGWSVDPQGFGVIFAQAIPPFARENVGPAVKSILARSGHRMSDVDRFVCHPGGRKVVSALEGALELTPGSLDHERTVLASHGNMSAPTVLFVLDRVIRAGLPDCSVLNAMGPGFTSSCAVLRKTV
ncbi:type III polyketide synthase [Lichenihabitans psoromatis]|uniref:type III polyketide synthase n=1 Tax=Lichenihabitans psoromatis TaxID=2528642 RepID=UPI001036E791|nr:type III polyketide synthase [Lichenihabitans psoromatis]